MKSMNSNLTLGFLWQAEKEALAKKPQLQLPVVCVCVSRLASLQVVFAGWLGTAEHQLPAFK